MIEEVEEGDFESEVEEADTEESESDSSTEVEEENESEGESRATGDITYISESEDSEDLDNLEIDEKNVSRYDLKHLQQAKNTGNEIIIITKQVNWFAQFIYNHAERFNRFV